MENSFPQQAHYKKNEDGTYMLEFYKYLIDKDGCKQKGMIRVLRCRLEELPNDEGILSLENKDFGKDILSHALVDGQGTIYELIIPNSIRNKVIKLFKKLLRRMSI